MAAVKNLTKTEIIYKVNSLDKKISDLACDYARGEIDHREFIHDMKNFLMIKGFLEAELTKRV